MPIKHPKVRKFKKNLTSSLGVVGTVVGTALEYSPEIALFGIIGFAAYEAVKGTEKAVDKLKKTFSPSPDTNPNSNKSTGGGAKSNTTTEAPADTTGQKAIKPENLTQSQSNYADAAEDAWAIINQTLPLTQDNLDTLIALFDGLNTDELLQVYNDFGQRASTIGEGVLKNFALSDKHDLTYWLQQEFQNGFVFANGADAYNTMQNIWEPTGLWAGTQDMQSTATPAETAQQQADRQAAATAKQTGQDQPGQE